jgi:hypothetical protein
MRAVPRNLIKFPCHSFSSDSEMFYSILINVIKYYIPCNLELFHYFNQQINKSCLFCKGIIVHVSREFSPKLTDLFTKIAQAEHFTPDTKNIQAIRSNNSSSGYSNHILNTGHAYGTITDTMDIVRTAKKGKHLNTLERYHMYRLSREKLHMNDTYIDTHNPIFETLQELNTR